MTTDAAAFREIRERVTQHSQDIALGKQRMDQFEVKVEWALQAIARAEGEAKVEAEHTRRAMSRLFDRIGGVERDVSSIKGGIDTLRWLLPLSVTIVGIAAPVIMWLMTR